MRIFTDVLVEDAASIFMAEENQWVVEGSQERWSKVFLPFNFTMFLALST
jgi:hypothetical protein